MHRTDYLPDDGSRYKLPDLSTSSPDPSHNGSPLVHSAAWDVLEHQVLPSLLAGKQPGQSVRVWVIGCKTGEMAYALGILLHRLAGQLGQALEIQIFATDQDQHMVTMARSGLYSQVAAESIAPGQIQHYFSAEQGRYRIRKEIRSLVLFARHDLLHDPPFSRLDLVVGMVSLQNYDQLEHSQIFAALHFTLHPHGYLWLHSPPANGDLAELYTPLDEAPGIFRRTTTIVPRRQLEKTPLTILAHIARERIEQVPATGPLKDFHTHLLIQDAPLSILIDSHYTIRHLSRIDKHWLQMGEGPPSLNLLDVVHPALRLGLRTILLIATRENVPGETPPLPVERNGTVQLVSIRVQPLHEPPWARGYMRVVFHEQELVAFENKPGQDDEGTTQLLSLYADEIRRTRQLLWSMLEQYQQTFEDLQTSNEELQTSNEELQASHEELQASFEELQVSREELQHKIEEVIRSNNDLQNLITATDIATIFLDRNLNIMRVTPRVHKLFNLIAPDVGRPLAHITHRLDYAELLADTSRVLCESMPLQREVQRDDGCWFLVRILPYHTDEQRINGVVLTFVDITERKQAEQERERWLTLTEEQVAERTLELHLANATLRAEANRRQQLEKTRTALLQALVTAQEEERRRIARELHDQLGQSLTALRMGLATLAATSLPSAMIARLQQLAAQIDEDVDRLAIELRPSALDDLGLIATIQQHIEEWSLHTSIEVQFQATGIGSIQIPPEIAIVLYRVVQEALTNVLKHAAAHHVSVILEQRAGQIQLIVEDDGNGFDPDDVLQAPDSRRRLGLLGMQERVVLANGTFTLESLPGSGTTIFVRIPLHAPQKV